MADMKHSAPYIDGWLAARQRSKDNENPHDPDASAYSYWQWFTGFNAYERRDPDQPHDLDNLDPTGEYQ